MVMLVPGRRGGRRPGRDGDDHHDGSGQRAALRRSIFIASPAMKSGSR